MSLKTHTRTNEAKITVLLQTLNHINVCQIPFVQEKKQTRDDSFFKIYIRVNYI